MKKRFIIFAVAGIALALSVGLVEASPGSTDETPVTVTWEKAPWAENTVISQNEAQVTITATPDIVVAEPDVEGQEYIVQEDGTITIYLK